MISAQQKAQFFEQGYLVLPRLIAAPDCDRLRKRALDLVEAFETDPRTRTVFSTIAPKHDKDRYFLESYDKIRFFFEEEAFTADGRLALPNVAAINKIGHALHKLDPVFREFSYDPRLGELLAGLDYLAQPLIIQSMYIFKQPYIGGEVTCHQDSTFIHTSPNRLLGLWLALEDANSDNGCLWGIPGRYGEEAPRRLFVRKEDACSFETLDERPWDLQGLVPLQVEKGSVIIFHGLFPHLSQANRSPKSRHAYSLHFIDAGGQYLSSNWIRKPLEHTAPARL